jgi:hypothetical protein
MSDNFEDFINDLEAAPQPVCSISPDNAEDCEACGA